MSDDNVDGDNESFDEDGEGFEADDDYGFGQSAYGAVDDSGDAEVTVPAVVPAGPRKRLTRRKKVARMAVVAAVVGIACGGFTFFAASSGAASTASAAADIETGKQLYETSCIACHGANLQGVNTRGPSLIGVGSAATYFQVVTGRMPAAGQAGYEVRKPAKFTEAQTRQIAQYIESVGGGPEMPAIGADLRVTSDSQLAQGGELFRLNCASCHNFAGKGAPLSAGKIAPALDKATDAELYTAMLSGPENMPVFADAQITPQQKKEIITYIQTLKASAAPGGSSLGSIGPVSEGLVIWTVGLGVLMFAILWIGKKS